MSIHLGSQFDSGAITVVDDTEASNIRLRIRDDNAGDYRQWFHFRISGAAGVPLTLRFENAGECSYAEGWSDYRAVASYDRHHWFRVPTCAYDGEVLTVQITPAHDVIWLAYFEPYSHERHQDMLGQAALRDGVRLMRLGQSVQGREIDCLRVGEPADGYANIWIIARQHPGETMAEWFTEGLIERLLDAADPVAREVRSHACFYIVPNVNPDGAFLGNLRSNAAGANLNREWMAPSLARSPEVLCVREAMEATGVDFFLDIHGDETLPYVFADGSHMVPGYGARRIELQERFLQELAAASPDFQRTHGYTDDRFDDELLTLASKWVAYRFACVSITLEMPFKDNANAPDPAVGWNGARSKRLGAATLQPILDHLRARMRG